MGEREIVVCPRFLVPDTNGFVDQLENIRTLVECGHFILAVPLVGELEVAAKSYLVHVCDCMPEALSGHIFVCLLVVTELEGLSKGTMKEKAKEGDKTRGKKVLIGAK